MKPNYSHTYQSCVYSMKRENAPWRVSGGCGSPARLFNGKHYQLPNKTVCLTCQSYVPESEH